jgi:gliding motility-associated-like protein
MKKLLLTVFLLLGSYAYSQYCPLIGPDQFLPCGVSSTTLTADLSQCAAGPAPNQTTNYNLIQIPYVAQTNTGTLLSMGDDSQQGPYPIGFNFCFYGTSYSQFWIGSNGWISFSAGQPTTFTSQPLPTTNALVPRNCIMGPWQDWHPGLGGEIRYQTVGVAPCRKLIVSWIDVPMFSCTANQGTFHIVICESTNTIESFIQSKPDCVQWQNGTSVHGIHNSTGTAANIVPGRNSAAWSAQNDAWRWVPAGPAVVPVLTWYQVGNPIAIGTGASINVTPPFVGANYTCHLEYPLCNEGWNTCNAIPGLGPDTIYVQPGQSIPAISPIVYSDTICYGASSSLYEIQNSMPSYNYVWASIGNITSPQGQNTATIDWSSFPAGFIPNAVSVYATDISGCNSDTVFASITIYNETPLIDSVGPFCSNENCVTLTATPPGGIFTQGSTFCPGTANSSNEIYYTYTQSQCSFYDTISIIVNPQPYITNIGPDNEFYEICAWDSVTQTYWIESNLSGITEWYLLGQTYQDSTLTYTWNTPGQYIISVTETVNECTSPVVQTSVTIAQCPEELIYVPNAFTPGNDEYNDGWKPIFTDGYDPTNVLIEIYNRWGQIIWESYDASVGWDGSYDGYYAPDGIYSFVITYASSVNAEKSTLLGHIVLIR